MFADPDTIRLPHWLAGMRRVPLDDALLLFDRDTGWNALCDGPECAGLRQRAPRIVQFAITNRCNLACTFCSRDTSWQSGWTADSAFALLRDLAAAGVLEVAFGGGEPLVFPGFDALVARLHFSTPLAINLTTNGLLLTPARIRALAPHVGQLRLSLYDDNQWRAKVALLAHTGVRFGVNWLITPARLPGLEATVLELIALGCRDVLLLSYNGLDPALHLAPVQAEDLARRVGSLARALRGRCAIKLGVCWGSRLDAVPQLFAGSGCGAGREFVVVTSDRRLQPCSFHGLALPFDDAGGLLALWRARAVDLARPAKIPGCARLAGFGLADTKEE